MPRQSGWARGAAATVSRKTGAFAHLAKFAYIQAMDRNDAVTRLKACADAVKARGALALYLFGSAARNEAVPESDLDLFIDYDPTKKFSLVDLVGIKHLLEDSLGVEVDLTTRDSLHPMLRKNIEKSAIRVF
jgi:uncharacterized protein